MRQLPFTIQFQILDFYDDDKTFYFKHMLSVSELQHIVQVECLEEVSDCSSASTGGST